MTECYFTVIGIPYLFVDNLPVVDYSVQILSAYNKIFCNDRQKNIIIMALILIYTIDHRNNSLVT